MKFDYQQHQQHQQHLHHQKHQQLRLIYFFLWISSILLAQHQRSSLLFAAAEEMNLVAATATLSRSCVDYYTDASTTAKESCNETLVKASECVFETIRRPPRSVSLVDDVDDDDSDDACLKARYQYCPIIMECYSSCNNAVKSKYDEYFSCITTSHIVGLSSDAIDVVGVDGRIESECKLDCKYFDYSDGLHINLVEDGDGTPINVTFNNDIPVNGSMPINGTIDDDIPVNDIIDDGMAINVTIDDNIQQSNVALDDENNDASEVVVVTAHKDDDDSHDETLDMCREFRIEYNEECSGNEDELQYLQCFIDAAYSTVDDVDDENSNYKKDGSDIAVTTRANFDHLQRVYCSSVLCADQLLPTTCGEKQNAVTRCEYAILLEQYRSDRRGNGSDIINIGIPTSIDGFSCDNVIISHSSSANEIAADNYSGSSSSNRCSGTVLVIFVTILLSASFSIR